MRPIQYQKGYVEWYKLRFKVTPDVLIPRPETELLVDEVLNRIKNHELRIMGNHKIPNPIIHDSKFIILDIGAGSGNIAIALAKNLASHLEGGNVKIIAVDISKKALEVAKQNAKLHGVKNKIIFLESNLLSSVILNPKGEGSQDSKSRDSSQARNDNLVIVTNLPYIPTTRIPTLDPSVKDFEPYIALDGGEDGFDLYRKLFRQISRLHPKGVKLIIGEIDYTQANIAITEGKKYFPGYKVEIKKDLNGMQRFFLIK